jgi:sucrose phosphorylase
MPPTDLLASLYGPDAVPDLQARIEHRVAATEAALAGRSPVPPWSERDAWLISYADQFQVGDTTPLATLDVVLGRWFRPWLNGVHVLPFHPYSSDDGFAPIDFGEVDGRYGTWEDISRLGRHGRLMVDAVINHTSVSSPWFRGFVEGDPGYAGFYRTVAPGANLAPVVRARTHPLVTTFDGAAGPVGVWTTFSADQADLDYRNPEVMLAVVDVLLRYVERGADVIRLDAIAFAWKEEGTASLHLPQTHALVQLLRAVLDLVDDGVALITETNVPHEENISYFGPPGAREAQAVYQFPLPPLVLHTMLGGDATALAAWTAGLGSPQPQRTFANFLSSHDGIGMRPAEGLLGAADVMRMVRTCADAGGKFQRRTLADGSEAVYELNSTWFDLMAVGFGDEAGIRRHLAAHAIMAALRGIPLLYVHSALGSSNDQEEFARTGRSRSVHRAKFALGDVDRLAAPGSRAGAVLGGMRDIFTARAGSPAFHPAAAQHVLDTPPRIFAIERTTDAGSRALVVVNVSTEPVQWQPPSGNWVPAGPGGEGAELQPWEHRWLREDG